MNRKLLKKISLFALLLVSLFFIISALLIVADGLTDEIHQSDVAVVLGNTVEKNGLPSPRLQARLDKTIELYQKGLFPNIIVSGGFGSEGFDEAIVMRQYLISRGIPENCIRVDSVGNTTALTAKNASQIMKQNNWHSAMIISQYFHISRTRLAFVHYGVNPIYSAHANYFEIRDFYSIFREVIGYFSYVLRGADD
jgi:vancomycin permeability regulator SanA